MYGVGAIAGRDEEVEVLVGVLVAIGVVFVSACSVTVLRRRRRSGG
jgi:hypothetical protein